MSKSNSVVARRRCAALVRFALVWTVWLAPLHWCGILAEEPHAALSSSAPWKRGTSIWNGTGYLQPTSESRSGAFTDAVPLEEPAPYTVPVDPNLYTEPLVDVPYDLNQGTPASTVTNVMPSLAPASSDVPAESVPAMDVDAAPPVNAATENEPLILPAPNIGRQIQNGLEINEPPLQEETLRWYQYPWRWMTAGWKNHAEFGLDGSRGNADTLALQTGIELKRKTDIYTLALDADYRLANNGSTIIEDNGRFNIDYDRIVAESPWSLFGKYGMEWDKFKAFDLRINFDGGVGYFWIRNERTTFVSRFGAGVYRKIGAPIDRWTPEAVFSLDGEHQLNARNKFKGKVDYFPAWEDFADYRIVTDLGWEILLDNAENLSLKLAVTDRYDSTPQGAEANDVYYSALLLVKF